MWKLFLVPEKDNCLNFPYHPSKYLYYLSGSCRSRRKNRKFPERFLSTAVFEYCGFWVTPKNHLNVVHLFRYCVISTPELPRRVDLKEGFAFQNIVWSNQIGTVWKRTFLISLQIRIITFNQIIFARHEYGRIEVFRIKMRSLVQKFCLLKSVNFPTVPIWLHHTAAVLINV